jgi:hypothetical protein
MKQLILCVETNKQANTDVGYIDTVIKQLYYIDTEIKLQYEYFSGKGRYKDSKLLKNIKKDIKALKDESLSNVVYFIDTDKYDSNPEDQQLNSEIQAFCQQNGYKLIWFCRDVEEVFLHKMVDDSKKKVEVAKFKSGNNLGKATEATLSATSMSKKKSNMLLILDRVLERK